MFFCQFTTTFNYCTTFTTGIHYAVVETKKSINFVTSLRPLSNKIWFQYYVHYNVIMIRNHYLKTHHYVDYVATFTTQISNDENSINKNSLPLRLDQDRKYIFSIRWCVWYYMVKTYTFNPSICRLHHYVHYTMIKGGRILFVSPRNSGRRNSLISSSSQA